MYSYMYSYSYIENRYSYVYICSNKGLLRTQWNWVTDSHY